ncbi:hypothetical protein MKX01_037592, partial [Papaver californicum]
KIGGTKTYIREVDGFLDCLPNVEVDAKNIKILNLVHTVKGSNMEGIFGKSKNMEVDSGKASKEEVDTSCDSSDNKKG